MNHCDKLKERSISGGFKVNICTSEKKGHPNAVDVPIEEDRPLITYENRFCKTCDYQSGPYYPR